VQVEEPKTENSGLPQGTFLKRAKVHLPSHPGAPSEHLTWQSLRVGLEVPIHGRVFRIVGADPFTRRWYGDKGIVLGADEPVPRDDNPGSPRISTSAASPAAAGGSSRRGEPTAAALASASMAQFLEHDGKVLRYSAVHDDRKTMHGLVTDYILSYFLSDDTVEVSQARSASAPQSATRAGSLLLLKRVRLPKRAEDATSGLGTSGVRLDKSACVSFRDLVVGGSVDCFGRTLQLVDCDPFTRAWFAKNHGFVQPERVKAADATPARPRLELPPHTGYGTEVRFWYSIHTTDR
jgi:hypothetical protein